MRFLLLLTLAVCLRAETPPASTPLPSDRIHSSVLVLSPDWVGRIPPTGAVNAPEFFTTVYPGQRIALGLVADGPDREHAFDGATIGVRISSGTSTPTELRGLKPATVRLLKAEGADFTLMTLEAAGISKADRAEMAPKTTLVTLAAFIPEWSVPAATAATDITLTVELTGAKSPAALEPVRLRIRPTSDWLAGPPLSAEAAGKQMNRYRAAVAPGELIAALRAFAREGHLGISSVSSYFAFAFNANPVARAEAISVCTEGNPELQPALLRVLRLGGVDLPQSFPTLAGTAALEPFETMAPIEDPRKLPRFKNPVDPQAVSQLGNTMDQCWAGWMTTGDKSYLRALVELLDGAEDFPALVAWQQARTGAKGLNARVARGLGYQIAGWSIGSFQRSDPLVMDWLLYWQTDPSVSTTVRREIAALPTNPAFRRK